MATWPRSAHAFRLGSHRILSISDDYARLGIRSSTGVSAADIAVPKEGNSEKVNLVEGASRLLRTHRIAILAHAASAFQDVEGWVWSWIWPFRRPAKSDDVTDAAQIFFRSWNIVRQQR